MTEKNMSKNNFYGEKLRLARLNANISLNDLGKRVKASRQYIHQLETADKSPAHDLLEALCFELNVVSSFFESPIHNYVKDEECHYRKLKSVPVTAIRECTAKVTLANTIIQSLETKLNLPLVDFNFDKDVTNFLEIEKIASDFRKRWGLGAGPVENIVRALENAGAIIVSFRDVSEKVDALSLFRKRPIIIFNSNKSSCRIRFDLAHECAHLIMHKGIETGDYETESQADFFASCFLLPKEALFKEYSARHTKKIDWNQIKNIKIKWGISSRAIIYKLNQYEIISPSQFRSANVTFSKTGQTKSEYYDDLVPREYPELLPSSLSLLGKAYGSGYGGVLTELGITSKFLADITNCNEVIQKIERNKTLPKNLHFISDYR